MTSPSGSSSKTYYLNYYSSSGTCGSTPQVTETWKKNIGYTFCPEEGTYTATVTASSAGGDPSCSSYGSETSGSYDLYTVNYDSDSNWCSCKGGSWLADKCCGDDAGEDYTNSGTGNPACVNGNVVQHDNVSTDQRYLVYNGLIYYCVEAGGSGESSPILNVNPGSSVGSWKCEQDGIWRGGTGIIPIRGGRIKIV